MNRTNPRRLTSSVCFQTVGTWLFCAFVSILSTIELHAMSQETAQHSSGTSYYVDSENGNDNNDGTSQSTPWKSLTKANSLTLQPGDKLLFRSGGVWSGRLQPKGSGTAKAQIIISSYGDGPKPLINGQGTPPTFDGTYYYATGTVEIKNQEYITIDGLAVTNRADPNQQIRDGIKIALDKPNTILRHIQITNNEVYDVSGQASRVSGKYNDMYANGAIHLWAQGTLNQHYHYEDILIKGNSIHDVDTSGIRVHNRDDYPVYSPFNTNVLIDSNTIDNTGSDGMIVANCNTPIIQYNRVLRSGGRSIPETHIIAGAWVCSSHGGIFQYNEVAYTKLIDSDGTAFDTDWGTSGTVIFQYNYTHHNGGGIWLDCANLVPQDHYEKTIIRYNISLDEGESLLRTSGGGRTAEVYNNVFQKTKGSYIMDHDYDGHEHHYWNNIFYFENAPDWQSAQYANNLYYPCTPNPADKQALNENPLFLNPGSAIDGFETIDGYQLSIESPAIDSGSIIAGAPARDLWGNRIQENKPDLGAHEFTQQR